MQHLFRIAASVLAATFLCGAAHAQMFRAYLASSGADSNPCTVTAPCRLLPAALGAVSNGGEIWILDSANYNAGAVDIGKDVTILAVPGAVGSFVAVAAGPALTITTNVTVHLRNIVIANNAANPGTDGIQVGGQGRLDVEGCVFSAAQAGIRLTSGFLNVHGSVFTKSTFGISAEGGSYFDVSNTRFSNMRNTGIRMQGSTELAGNGPKYGAVSDSSFTDMNIGIALVTQPAPASLSAAITHITVSDAEYGVFLSCGGSNTAIATVGRSMFAHLFSSALYQSGACAVLESLGDNEAHGNGANTSGTITPASGF